MSPSSERFPCHDKEWKSTTLSSTLSPLPPPPPPLCDSNIATSHHVSVDCWSLLHKLDHQCQEEITLVQSPYSSDDSVVSSNCNIQSDSSLVPSSDSSIQSELSSAFDTLENSEGLDETVSNNNNNNNNVTLIRHVNVAKHHTIMQEVLRANSLVHGTRRHTNLSSPQVDLIHSFDVLYDTNQSQSKSRWASICMAKAGREHVYIMRGSGGCNNILKLHLTSRCGEKEVIWLGRRSRKDDVDGNKRMVRAMAVVEDDHNDHDHRNTIVTSEQSARGNRHEIRVWQSESESGSDHYNNNNYYTCAGTLPDRYSWDRVRQSLVASNYVRVRRHHTRLWTDHVDAITCLAFCQSHRVLYSVSWDRSLKVWRLSDLRCLQSVARAHDDAINACVVCQRSAAVFTAGADATVKLWSSSSSSSSSSSFCSNKKRCFRVELVATLAGHRAAVNALALSPDGRLLYSGSADRSVRVWSIKTATAPVAVLVGHRGAVLCLSSVPETATATDVLCSGSEDKTVRVWRRWHASTWACVAVLHGHAAPLKSLIIMPMPMPMPMPASASAAAESDLRLSVVSASSDGHVRLWSLK